jgi:hypothetical protein
MTSHTLLSAKVSKMAQVFYGLGVRFITVYLYGGLSMNNRSCLSLPNEHLLSSVKFLVNARFFCCSAQSLLKT